jgi:NAD(P) transhydrogenase
MDTTCDVIVIGAGPGGEGAAMQAAKRGRSVVMIERYCKVGGGCTHWGTIPSKALRHTIQNTVDLNRQAMQRMGLQPHFPSFPELLRSAESVIGRQVAMRQAFYDRNRVPVVHGQARFVDTQVVEVEKEDGKRERFQAAHVVVATGSRPYRPPDVTFDDRRVCDSNTILSLPGSPQSLTIYGAGAVGCEYASMFRNFGMKVNLINVRDRLLSFLDDEIIDALAYHLREQGVLIRHNEAYDRVELQDDHVILHLKSGKQVKSDVLLWANGRTGNSEGMGLEKLGVEIDQRGLIKVDENYRTAAAHVYAVGDVIGFPSLASAAYDQGRFAAIHLCDGACDTHLTRFIPLGIYTSPEISSLGSTEQELTAAHVPYEVGHSFFKSLARAQIVGQDVGMLKLLFHRETLEILGIHCFGYQAAEIIHIGQVVMSQPAPNNTLNYFTNTTFNYPTMAEAYRVSALNGLNRLS